MLEIAVDPARLYYGGDPLFEIWLADLADRVSDEHRRIEREAKSKSGKGKH